MGSFSLRFKHLSHIQSCTRGQVPDSLSQSGDTAKPNFVSAAVLIPSVATFKETDHREITSAEQRRTRRTDVPARASHHMLSHLLAGF